MLVLYIIVYYNTVKVVAVVLGSNSSNGIVTNSSGVSIELYILHFTVSSVSSCLLYCKYCE